MSDGSDRKPQAERHARRLAASLAKGRMPKTTPAFEDYLDGSPNEVFVTLDGFVRHAASGHARDVSLARGFLFLMECQLERIRYRKDRGYEDAARLIEAFQRAVADLSAARRLDRQALMSVGSALHRAGIPASPELAAAIGQHGADLSPGLAGAPPDIAAALEAAVEECGGDPFLLAASLAEAGHSVPAEARALMVGELAHSPSAVARATAILFMLDSEPRVRRAAAAAIEPQAATLSSVCLRRLIAMRNWRPESERPVVDAIVRAARAKGIDCAPWQGSGAEAIRASAIDGSGAQGFLIVSPAGRRRRLSSVLLKQGVRDAWSAPPQSQREIGLTLAQTATAMPIVPVSRDHLDRAVRHHLQVGLSGGALPPPGLLQVAESVGGADWQPELLQWRDALTAMLADLPAAMLEPRAVRAMLRKSAQWADLEGIAESWFEDDQDVARLLAGIRRGQLAKLAEYVLDRVVARRREKWAELFVWTAIWLREAPAGDDLPWREFVILARALAEGSDMAEISVMRDIAARTVMVLADVPALRDRPSAGGGSRGNRLR